MLYAALTFWLFIIIVTAWGVHTLWSGLVKPRVVNAVLLPGTLVAQLGHVLGLLITGNPVRNTELMSDDEKGAPKSEQPERQRIPILGPILVGLLPLTTTEQPRWRKSLASCLPSPRELPVITTLVMESPRK